MSYTALLLFLAATSCRADENGDSPPGSTGGTAGHVGASGGQAGAAGSQPGSGGSTADSGSDFEGGTTPSVFNIVLGRPTRQSMAVSVLAETGAEAFVEYGTSTGSYPGKSATGASTAGEPIVAELTGLQPDTRYFYRLKVRAPGEADYRADNEQTFVTARAPGSTFSFGVQGDSHPERPTKMYSADLYALNMANAASRRPDFYFALGDDFSIERLLEKNTLTQDAVDAVYLNQRSFFGILGSSTAVFLVNGNHEQAAGYLLTDAWPTPYADAPIFAGLSRLKYYPQPFPNDFYTGDVEEVPGIGKLGDYYAWEWGDALFVTIDPYWHSAVPVDTGVPGVTPPKDGWAASMGDAQYAWFKQTLEGSQAKYKFVFEHHVLGNGRGAAAIVHSYEWGGYDSGGKVYEFPSKRPTWDKPIHQLMVENNVTVFFFGHDHVFAREMVDGIVYQSVQNPADNTYTAFNSDAFDPETISLPGAVYDPTYGVVLPNSGYLHVTVSPENVTVSYVRAVLPGDEAKAGCANGDVAQTYTIPAD